MDIRLLRHATLLMQLDGFTVLVDPMFSAARSMEPIANAGNQNRIPMVDLLLSDEELVQLMNEIDGVLVTHTHRDHWDTRAQELVPRDLPLFCQPEDEALFTKAGFTGVQAVGDKREWSGLRIY